MAVVLVAAFLALVLLLAYIWKEEAVDVLPVAACILILVLYILAFVRRLSDIDRIGGLFLLAVMACTVYRCRRRQAGRQNGAAAGCEGGQACMSTGEWLKKTLGHPGVAVALLVFVGTALLVQGRVAVWWDDVNFWATDVRAIYALDGFAAKYANAAPEFGDYPPGSQLLKWWFLHFCPDGFSEGLMFAGYYFGVFVFWMPFFRRLRGKNPLLLILAAICLWAFPSVAEAFYCQGMCADLMMASLFGAFLAAVADGEGHRKSFYLVRLALYLAVLVLVKSVGFVWAAFGLVFLLAWKWKQGRQAWKEMLAVAAVPAITGGSWLLFCLSMRRVAKLTGAALMAATGKLPILLPGTRGKLAAAYLEAYAFWPLHRGKTWAVDFSPVAMLAWICFLVFFYTRCKILTRREGRILGIFLPACGLLFYGINLVAHLTIFAAETQYLEPFAMVSSIERYGAPFTVGSLYLLAWLFVHRKEGVCPTFLQGKRFGRLWRQNSVYLVCFAFVLCAANWPEVFDSLWGYRTQRENVLAERRGMITGEAEVFLEKVSALDVGDGIRVLYLQDKKVSQWVKNTYVAFEASPVSVVFGGVDCETMNSAEVWEAMDGSHAQYLYLDAIPGNVAKLFSPFGDDTQSHTLYRILQENGQIRLKACGSSLSG